MALALCFIAPTVQCQSSQSASLEKPDARPFNMLVLGDSIMWGEGLKSDHKAWYQMKVWLAQRTGRPINERIEAHSGAVIELENADETRAAADGEVNVAVPTLNQQLEAAVRHYANGRQVDLVVVTGCANDVDVKNVLNAGNSTEEIRLLTEAKCGPPVRNLLRRITRSFPTAYVIVAGYYPFVTQRTRNDIFMRGLTKRFYKAIAGTSKLNQKAVFKQVVANSDQWYRSSNNSLSEAVRTVNGELGGTESRGRVRFAEMHFLPEHSFRAPKTQLWNFESSPIRKLLVILSFGKILLRSNDEVRKQRYASCKEYWKAPTAETESQKKERKNQQLLCRYAALGHPNRQGSTVYAQTISKELNTMFPALSSK
jgi:lysophospholipase L1-like esterase